jgi:hypothetical protein
MKNTWTIGLLLLLSGPSAPTGTARPLGTDVYEDTSKTVQFDVSPLLNARSVTTFLNGELITWNKGVDDSWSGLATRAAADKMGSVDKIAFPDDGTFAANPFHPLVVLHFSNADANGNQVRFTHRNAADSYSFDVEAHHYAHLSLFFMSAFGSSELTAEILYHDQFSETRTFSIEDWAVNFTETEDRFILSSDLAKWGDQNTELEPDNHYLTGINLKPDPTRRVSRIIIRKPASESTLTFWGASGYIAGPPL